MASKKRLGQTGSGIARPAGRPKADRAPANRNRLYMALAGGGVALVAVIAVAFVALGGAGSTKGPSLATGETIHQAQGGEWTNVTPDRLAQMLQNKDFTLVNVKTPYMGEIAGTDLYIPYDQLGARSSELPADKTAKILVYCRSGVESGQAAQTLLNLGYTNVWNLDGGMSAWQQSGRTLVNKNRQ